MDRRVQQVNTLQELGLLEASGGQGGSWRSDTDQGEEAGTLTSRSSPSSHLLDRSSPSSTKFTPPLPLGARLRTGSDPALLRPDPSPRLEAGLAALRLEPGEERREGRGLAARLSPRLGRRNPLRMLSNAIDFRARRKTRPKSADCSEERRPPPLRAARIPQSPRSASVTDLLETVSLSPGPTPPRPLEGHNSAPDLLPGRRGHRARLSAAASAKQKLSTRFQPQRKAQHRALVPSGATAAVRRAKTFSLGAQAPGHVQTAYKTLPKQASSRSLGSSSTDSSQGSMSTASSRKSSNSSNLSSDSSSASARAEISRGALEEIAAFERFIQEYFDMSCDNNNVPERRGKPPLQHKVSATSGLSEVLELSI